MQKYPFNPKIWRVLLVVTSWHWSCFRPRTIQIKIAIFKCSFNSNYWFYCENVQLILIPWIIYPTKDMQQTVTSWCHGVTSKVLCHQTSRSGSSESQYILRYISKNYFKINIIHIYYVALWTINPIDIQIECLQIRHHFWLYKTKFG